MGQSACVLELRAAVGWASGTLCPREAGEVGSEGGPGCTLSVWGPWGTAFTTVPRVRLPHQPRGVPGAGHGAPGVGLGSGERATPSGCLWGGGPSDSPRTPGANTAGHLFLLYVAPFSLS